MKLSRIGKNNRRRAITILLVILIVYYIYNPYSFIDIYSPIKLHEIDKVDPLSFWHSPWGESGVHKGVDIFSGRGSIIYSAVKGIVFRSGYGTKGGHYVYILGVDCRLHYYAHLDTILIQDNVFVSHTTAVGRVGSSGNAMFKPPHLHYSIQTFLPDISILLQNDTLKSTKMFYVNPYEALNYNFHKVAQ